MIREISLRRPVVISGEAALTINTLALLPACAILYYRWERDGKNGVMTVRTPFLNEQNERQGFEVRCGVWAQDEFLQWQSPPIYPDATREFLEKFAGDDIDPYDPFALLISKQLPVLPLGVDPHDIDVQAVISRLIAMSNTTTAGTTASSVT